MKLIALIVLLNLLCCCLCFENQNATKLVRIKRNLGRSLINAVRNNQPTNVKISEIKTLLNAGADINTQDPPGNTALHYAVNNEDIEIIKLLVSRNANTNIKNMYNKTPFDYTKRSDIKDILSNRKRGPSDPHAGPSKKHKAIDVEPSTSGAQLEEIYEKAGLISAQHGVEYQKRLLVMFYLRGVKSRYDFQLATEMVAAEKFDDVVFKYKEPNSNNYHIRFIQAKHKLEDSTKIKYSDLTTNDVNGEFNLRKYFDSFRKISQNELFKTDFLKDFVLTTNIDIDPNILHLFEQSTENDIVFENKKLEKPKIYRLSEQSKSELVPMFQETSDLHQLAKKFAQLAHSNSDIDLKSALIKKYYKSLVYENIIDIGGKKLNADFISDNKLSKVAQDFRKIFVEEYKGLLKKNEIFDPNKISLKLSGTFDKLKKRTSTEIQRKCAGWLAKLLVEHKVNEVLIQTIPPENLAYLEEMAGHVFVDHVAPNRYIFDRNFVLASNIPQNVIEFRNLLDAELKQKKFNFPEISRLKLTIFGYKPTGLPKNMISDADIRKFYKTFKMAVNQPNEQKLYGIIEKEIPDFIQGKTNLRDNLLVEVGDWMISQKGTYLSKERITKYTKQIKEQNIWFEVGKPIESFSGREEELRKLKFLVEEELGYGANWRSRLLVVNGFKGVGKSELVKKYVNDNANTFDKNIVWLDGQSLEESFYKLARSNDVKISTIYEDGTKKPVENIVNEVYEFFVRNEKKGLFIFDNVDHFEKIKAYLPSKVAQIDKLKVKFLATSSNKDWDNVRELNLDVFKLDESRDFLLDNLEDYVNSDFIGFEKLSIKMSNFPLALEQSIAYIKQQNKILKVVGKSFKIDDYLSRFETKAKELLNYDYSKYSVVSYDKNVLTNVALTLDAIKEKGTEAVDMANIMAYLDPNDISVELFLQNENIENTARMISYLKDYSLINSGERGNTFYMHELIQQIIRIQLKEAGTEFTVIENTLNLLKENLPTERLNHVVNIWKYVHEADSFKDKYVSLMEDAMKSLIDEGRYNEVESYGNQILIDNEKHSLESLYKTEIERFKSYALVEKGQYDKALMLTKNLHEAAIAKDGPTYFETLKRYADYGTVLLKQKKFGHSLEVFDFIIDNVKNEKEFKAFVKNNKAIALLQNGKANEAIALLNEIQRDNSGKKLDKLTFMISDNKAFSLYKNGQMKESLTEYNTLKEKCETEYGNLHLSTQKTINNIGMVYRAMGEYKTALNQFTPTFNYFQTKLGSEHPLTLKSKLCIANVYVDMGNIQQALDIYNEVYTIQENSLVDESVKLKTEYLKAKALLQDKNHPEAIKMFTEILNKADKIFGTDHSIREKIREELNELEEEKSIAFGADRCTGTSRLRRNAIKCFDSTKEEMLKEKTKSQVEHYFRNTEIHGMEYKQFYMYLAAASEQVAKNDVLNPELQKLLEKQLKNIRLEFVEPSIRPIVKELQKNINNKTKFKFILKAGSYHVIKAAEKANLAFILLMVGHHIYEGDVKGLAFDGLNIAVLPYASRFTEMALIKFGARFNSIGIKAAAPFLGRAVGNIFAIYQLVDSIMDRKNAHTIAEKNLNNLNIVSNSLFLAAETPYLVGSALASLGFAVEGFTAVAGPLGFLIGTAILVGGHFLQAKFQVDKINEQIKLMDDERSSLYWRFVEFRSIPDYLLDDIKAEHVFKQYAETTVHDFKSNYDTVGMSLPCIKSKSYDYRSSNIRYPFIKKGSVSRELPSSLSDYEAVCAPTDLNVKKTGDSLCLTEYPSECQNVFILKNKRNRSFGNAFYMPTEATININNAEHLNNLFIIKELSSSMIINESNNTFILMGSKFNCNLGSSKQNNVIVVQESATIVASNVKGIQCNNNTNVVNFEQADYVDCNGGNDVLHSKRYSIFKSYYGDTFNGEGLVLLPMKLKEIIKINVDAKNFTNIFSTKGSIKIYKTMHLQTLDGFLVHPLRTYNQTEVTHMQVIKRVPGEKNMQQAIEELRDVNNPSFELSKQAINEQFQVVLGDNANHIFYASESQFKTIYWEAPDNVDHLYLIKDYPIHIIIGKANGLLDFSLLYITFEDALISVTHESIIFEIGDLKVSVTNNYKRLALTFDGNRFYRINSGKIERDYCVKKLNIQNTIQINVTDMNYYNCFAFDSEKAIFVKIDKSLWIMTDHTVLSIIDYFKDLDHPEEFTVKLKNKLIIPDEVNERVKNSHTFVIYEPKDGEEVDVFHNQPLNNYQIGILNLNNHSILDFDLKFEKNNSLVLSNKGARVALLENWRLLPEAREMVFSFKDNLLYLPKCVIGSCAAEDILTTFYNEKKLVQGENPYIHKMFM